MVTWLSVVVAVAAGLLAVTAVGYALASRLVDDRLLLLVAVLEVALFAQLVLGIVKGISRSGDYERAVFFAYLGTVPFVPPVATFLALKEKTRSSMLVVAGSAAVVGVLVARLVQIWGSGG